MKSEIVVSAEEVKTYMDAYPYIGEAQAKHILAALKIKERTEVRLIEIEERILRIEKAIKSLAFGLNEARMGGPKY